MCDSWVSCSTKGQGQNCHFKYQSEFTMVTFYLKGTFLVRCLGLYLEILNSLTLFCDDNICLICQCVLFVFYWPTTITLINNCKYTHWQHSWTNPSVFARNEHLIAPGLTFPMPSFQLTHYNWLCAKLSCLPAQIPFPTHISSHTSFLHLTHIFDLSSCQEKWKDFALLSLL